jgi:hypothetical protein
MLSGLMAFGMIAGGLLGMGRGIGKAKQRELEYQAKLEEIQRQQTILDTQFNQARQSYDLGVSQARESTAEANAELDLLATETIVNRDRVVGQTQKAGAMQSVVNAMQLAELQVQNTQQTGAARQQAATSGFRGTGTAQARVENAISAGEAAKNIAQKQNKIATFQTYSSALNTYTSANQQEDAYRRKIEMNESALGRELAKLDLGLAQAREMHELQGGYLASDLEYLKTEGRRALDSAKTWDVIGGIGGGILQGLGMFA